MTWKYVNIKQPAIESSGIMLLYIKLYIIIYLELHLVQ